MNNREKGLALYKLASGHPQMTKMAIGALLASLPRAAGAFLKYKPQMWLRRAGSFIPGMNSAIAPGGRAALRTAGREWAQSSANTAQAYNKLNPWVQGAMKYPAQFAGGYVTGMPLGVAGGLGVMASDQVENLRSKQEGATEALTGVHDQMSQMGQQLGGMGMMDRAGLAFKMLTDGNFAPGLLQGAQGQLEAKIKEINPKAYAQRFGQAAPPPTQNYNR